MRFIESVLHIGSFVILNWNVSIRSKCDLIIHIYNLEQNIFNIIKFLVNCEFKVKSNETRKRFIYEFIYFFFTKKQCSKITIIKCLLTLHVIKNWHN